MPNQMIALQARAPQADILGGSIQRSAQMINMMRQQAAAERQNAVAEQQMQLAKADETRKAQAAGLDRLSKAGAFFRDALASWVPFGDVAAAQSLRDQTVQQVPELDKLLPTAQALATNRDLYNQAYMTADQLANKRFGTATTSTVIDPVTNEVKAVNASGLPGGSFAQTVPDITADLTKNMASNPAAAPSGATPPPYTPPSAAADDAAIDAAAKAIAGGAKVTDPAIQGLSPNDLKRAQDKAMQGALAQPISFNPAEAAGVVDLTVETAPQIIQTAVQNGMIDQKHLEQLRQIVGPENDQALAGWMRQNNVRIQPTGEASFRSAVYRPGGEDMLQEAQYNPGAYPAARGKPPMQSPLPGSASVPLPRVRAEAQAQRETPQEAAAKARATASAQADVEFDKKKRERETAKAQVGTIVKKIRGAYEALEKAQAIPSEKRGNFENFFDYLATTSGGREIQKMVGSKQSKYLSEITNSRKLLATAIKNATGMSAQEMNSNTELQLMLDALTDPTQGIEAARSTLDTIDSLYGSGAGSQASNSTAVNIPPAAVEHLRKNPALRGAFDQKYGAGAAAKVLGGR